MIKTLFTTLFNFIKTNWIRSLIISFILMFLFLLGGRYLNIFLGYFALIPVTYMTIFILVCIVFGWIINPYNSYMKEFHLVTIKKGHYYPVNILEKIPIPILYIFNNFKMQRRFKFDKSSLYYFPGNDIYDWSKLMGFSMGMHHQESYRIGFRFMELSNNDVNVEFCKYIYKNGIRIMEKETEICKCKLNEEYVFVIEYDKKLKQVKYSIGLNGTLNFIFCRSIEIVQKPKIWGYKLGIYIGGNNPAPNNIEILKRYKS